MSKARTRSLLLSILVLSWHLTGCGGSGADKDANQADCGDGLCALGENCSSCPVDCGECVGESSLSGRVTRSDDGQGAAGVRIRVFDARDSEVIVAVTDDAGNYSVAGLGAGRYRLVTWNRLGLYDELYGDLRLEGSTSLTEGEAIDIVDGTPIEGIDFELEPGGSISGITLDGTDSTPIADAYIRVIDSQLRVIALAQTDSSGSFRTPGLAAGDYTLRAYAEGSHLMETYDDVACDLGFDCPSAGLPVVVTEEEETSDVEFSLERGAVLSGTVTDGDDNAPIRDMAVVFYALTEEGTSQAVASAITDAEGRYASPGLQAGGFRVQVKNRATRRLPFRQPKTGYLDEAYNDIFCGSACESNDGDLLNLSTLQVSDDIHFALQRAGTISGNLTDAWTLDPVDGIQVSVRESGASEDASCASDANGDYSCDGLVPGNYTVRVDPQDGYAGHLHQGVTCEDACSPTDGTVIAVAPGQTADVDFALSRAYTISGTVTDSGTGTALAELSVLVHDGTGAQVASTQTLSDGRFQVGVDSAGSYRAMVFRSTNHFPQVYSGADCLPSCLTSDIIAGNPVSVTFSQPASNIDFSLTQAGVISGTVPGLAALPEGAVRVQANGENGFAVRSANLELDGTYVIGPLVTGIYYARTFNNAALLDEVYNDMPCLGFLCDGTDGTPISVIAGQATSGIDFSLQTGASIAGRVTDAATGEPINNAAIRLYNAGGELLSIPRSDSDGDYLTSGLPAGSYYVRASSDPQGYLAEVYDNVSCPMPCDPTVGSAITLSTDQATTGVDFTLALP